MRRRDLLESFVWLGAASGASYRGAPTLAAAAQLPDRRAVAPATLADDETFWATVRAAFEQVDGQTNLVTVVRGVTSRRVREAVEAESARLNAFRPREPADPDWRPRLKQSVAAFIGAPSADTIALVRNTTEGVCTVIQNWPLTKGDEILTSSAEHGPFYDTLASRVARDGVVPRRFHLPAPATSHRAIVDAIDAAMTPRTKLVMYGQVVLTGQIMPIRAIADVVHRRGARLLVDGVLGVGHIPTDVTAMDCDFYAAGFHKFAGGPRATAVFYVKPDLVARLPPLFGTVQYDADGRTATPLFASPLMRKYESFGAHPDAHYLCLEGALTLLSNIGMEHVRARHFALTSRWYARAQRLPGFRAAVALDAAQCAGLVAWEITGKPSADIGSALRAQHILTGGTEPYAGFFGIPPNEGRSLRVSNTALFTSPADMDRFADALERLVIA